MTLSHPIFISDIPPLGLDAAVAADEARRVALAATFEIETLHRLEGRFHLKTLAGGRVHVAGIVEADMRQICVVTLDPIETHMREEVDVTFAPQDMYEAVADDEESSMIDPPDLIVNGAIDLGALTTEFLALGLDPYPRKPDAVLLMENEAAKENPFAILAKLRDGAANEP